MEKIQISVEDPTPSFDTLFNQHWTRVVRILARFVGDPDEAEDLALEVFYKMYERFDRIDHAASMDGWIYRAAVHQGLNALRSKDRRKRYEAEAGMQTILFQPQPSPGFEAENREEQRQVRQILAEMQPRAAQLLVLRSSGLSYQGIGHALQIRASSIGTLLNRAEREFERRYRKRFGESENEASR